MSQITPIHAEAANTDKPPMTSPGGLDPIFLNNIKNASSDKELCYQWLQLQCLIIPDVRNAVVFLSSPEDTSFRPVSHLHDNFSVPEQYNELVNRVLKKEKGIALRSNQKPEGSHPNNTSLLLAYPCKADNEISGVVIFEISPRPSQEIQDAMRQLQQGVSMLQSRLLKKQTSIAPRTDTIMSKNLIIVNEIIASILKKKQSEAATTTAVTELANQLHCDRVSIGFRRKNQSRIVAISDSIRFGKKMNLIRAIEEAMDESQDQIASVSYPSSETNIILRAHEELARLSGAGSLLTVPFVDPDENAYGALTFERPAGEHFDCNSISLCKSAAALIGPILHEKRLNDRSLPTKAADSFKNQLRKIFGPGNLAAKLTVFALIAFILFFTFTQGQYRVTAASVLEGTVQRALIAPFDGYLYESIFKAGDIVNLNDILAKLDSRDLMLERLKWASQQKQHTLEYSKAMAENETASYKIIQEQIHQAESQLSLLEEQLSRAHIRAPFKGIIINGDLSQSIGAPVERGQVLFEIAPLDSYRIMLEVEEKDIAEISSGQKGSLILNALPAMSFPFSIVEMTPVSVTSQGKNVFLVEGKFEQTSDRLRPGMQGYGKIIIEKRNLLWIWTHDLVSAIKLWFWAVLP